MRGSMTGKIIKGIAGFYYVHDRHEKVYACKAKGVFRKWGIKPLVGDDVEFTVLDGNVERILPRRNMLIRPASANIDQALVVFSVAQPKPSLNLLDRFLVMMELQQIPVAICYNKMDLGGERERALYSEIYRDSGRGGNRGDPGASAGTHHHFGRPLRSGQVLPDQSLAAGGRDGDRRSQPKDSAGAASPPPCPAVLRGGGYVSDGYAGVQLCVRV